MNKRRMMILVGVVIVFVVIEVLMPKPLNWTPTYSHTDKNPYGAYALAKLLPGFLSEKQPLISPITLYETDSLPQGLNLLVLSEDFSPDEQDVSTLLRRVSEGDRAFIAAHYWDTAIMDTLGIEVGYDIETIVMAGQKKRDSLLVHFTQQGLPEEKFRFPATALPSYFEELTSEAVVLATMEDGKAVLAALPWGEGTIYLSSTPLFFTNYFLMQDRTRPYAEAALSYLPEQSVFWTEYYHLGRMEATTPLRFVLREPALRWSYYLGMGILFSFVLFSLKRRQRPIPVVEPPANTSIAFAETVARLYYSQQDHLDIARKKIIYFKEWLREHYHMPAGQVDEAFLKRLAQKSGKPETEVRSLFLYIEQIEQRPALSAEDLLNLENKIASFTRA